MDKKTKIFFTLIFIIIVITAVFVSFILLQETEPSYSIRIEKTDYQSENLDDFPNIGGDDFNIYPKLGEAFTTGKEIKLSKAEFVELMDFFGFGWNEEAIKQYPSDEQSFLAQAVFYDELYNIYLKYDARN